MPWNTSPGAQDARHTLQADEDCPTLGYHKIRGLGAHLRMMFYYKGQKFSNVAYGADMMETWHAGKKTELVKLNACINLPYIIDGDVVVTQSNTCTVYLGQRLGIDAPEDFVANHTVIDQAHDLRNNLMEVVYPQPVGHTETHGEFPEAARKHMAGPVKAHFTKLEGFCKGPYMCGDKPQSGDFHVFEMLDQHESLAKSLDEASVLEQFPKLAALHAAMKAEPSLAKYFEADCYAHWATNGPLIAHFTDKPADFEYGPTLEEIVTF